MKNIFESGELEEKAVISKMETTAADGKNYLTSFYNLDAVIAVGYRVNSFQATQFRIWATRTLKEFIINGFVDYAENQAARQIPMKMADWAGKLDAFLQFNEYEILTDAGKVSHEVALRLAEEQFEKFRVGQDSNFESDFDRELKKWKLE